jgi:hypothetical protein
MAQRCCHLNGLRQHGREHKEGVLDARVVEQKHARAALLHRLGVRKPLKANPDRKTSAHAEEARSS